MLSALAPVEPSFPLARRRAMVIGAVAWLATVEFFIAQYLAGNAAGGYSLWLHDISYLGVSDCGPFTDPMAGGLVSLCSPRHVLFNTALAMAGGFMALGAVLTRPFWGPSRRAALGLTMMAAGGIGALMAGIWPLDVDPQLHALGAGLNFSIGKIGLLLLGLGIRRAHPLLGRAAIAVAVVTLLAVGLYGQAEQFGLPRGALERIAVWPETLWLMAAGFAALRALLGGWGCGIKPLKDVDGG